MSPPSGFSTAFAYRPVSPHLLPRIVEIRIKTFRKSIWIYKITVSIIWRINIDQFYLSKITLLKQFKNFKIIAFDH